MHGHISASWKGSKNYTERIFEESQRFEKSAGCASIIKKVLNRKIN